MKARALLAPVAVTLAAITVAFAAGLPVDPDQLAVFRVAAPTPTPSPALLTLVAEADTYVEENNATTNFGTEAALRVKSHVTGGGGRTQRTFVRFDLSSIPAGATIHSATFKLFLFQAPGNVRTYAAHRVTGAWTESGVTWTTQPSVAAAATSDVSTGTTNNVTLSWDVQADVAAFVAGTSTNLGFRVSDTVETSASNVEGRFRSREATVNVPSLIVNYSPV